MAQPAVAPYRAADVADDGTGVGRAVAAGCLGRAAAVGIAYDSRDTRHAAVAAAVASRIICRLPSACRRGLGPLRQATRRCR